MNHNNSELVTECSLVYQGSSIYMDYVFFVDINFFLFLNFLAGPFFHIRSQKYVNKHWVQYLRCYLFTPHAHTKSATE